MRIEEAGRFVHRAGARAPRRYLERNLLSLHGRGMRLRAIAGSPRIDTHERDVEMLEAVRLASTLAIARHADWLLLRDYDHNARERSVLFLFRGDIPAAVVKVRARGSAGASLSGEAEALRAIRPKLDERMRATLPEVHDFVVNEAHEMLVLSALPGRSLSILMQRALRPRAAHVPQLVAAARWLGRFHRATGAAAHGDFWPRNILYGASAEVSGVVDWEHARTDGSRWHDVFLLPLLFVMDAPSWGRRDPQAEFRRAFTGRGVLADAVETYFRVYASEAGVERGIVEAELSRYLCGRDRRLFDIYSGVG
ncbi:MAG TPA: phosphotransferase [Thermoanaerobaculia bacterium]|nr:phosphotransferase [Thermoanaerobaculia bacterium]